MTEDDDLTLDEVHLFGLIFRLFFVFILIVIIVLTTYAGFKGWPWYIWIPFCGSGMLFIRIIKHSLSSGFDGYERELKDKIRTQAVSQTYSKGDIQSQDELQTKIVQKGVTLEEFMDMSPRPTDDVKLSRAYQRVEDRKNMTPTKMVIIGFFVVIIAGVFWYGLGLIIANIFSG
jgi:hypothetical protein